MWGVGKSGELKNGDFSKFSVGQKYGVACKVQLRGDIRHYVSGLLYSGLLMGREWLCLQLQGSVVLHLQYISTTQKWLALL